MLTRLGKVMMAMQMATNSPAPPLYNDNMTHGLCEFKDTRGNTRVPIPKFGYITYQLRTNLTDGNGGVAFGTGTTPATEEDYTLENIITSGISMVASGPTTYYDETTHKYGSRVDFTISNNGTDPITISEMCIYRNYNYSSTIGGTSAGSSQFMIDRSVLANPVTIPGGEAGVIRYECVYPNGIIEPET